MTQKNADLMYIVAEAWNSAQEGWLVCNDLEMIRMDALKLEIFCTYLPGEADQKYINPQSEWQVPGAEIWTQDLKAQCKMLDTHCTVTFGDIIIIIIML
jgi:hypothetical protein